MHFGMMLSKREQHVGIGNKQLALLFNADRTRTEARRSLLNCREYIAAH